MTIRDSAMKFPRPFAHSSGATLKYLPSLCYPRATLDPTLTKNVDAGKWSL
jgi:hypothetical protein